MLLNKAFQKLLQITKRTVELRKCYFDIFARKFKAFGLENTQCAFRIANAGGNRKVNQFGLNKPEVFDFT